MDFGVHSQHSDFSEITITGSHTLKQDKVTICTKYTYIYHRNTAYQRGN